MERLEKLAQEIFGSKFKQLGTAEQQILIGIQRNEIETKRNLIADTLNDIIRSKRFYPF